MAISRKRKRTTTTVLEEELDDITDITSGTYVPNNAPSLAEGKNVDRTGTDMGSYNKDTFALDSKGDDHPPVTTGRTGFDFAAEFVNNYPIIFTLLIVLAYALCLFSGVDVTTNLFFPLKIGGVFIGIFIASSLLNKLIKLIK